MASPVERRDLNELLEVHGQNKIPPVKMREYVLALAIKAYPTIFPYTEFDLSNLIEKLIIEAAFNSLGETEFQKITQSYISVFENKAQDTSEETGGEV